MASIESQEKGLNMFNPESLHMLLWSTWVCGIKSPDQDWFAPRIAEHMWCLGYERWDEVVACLREFVWTPKMHDEHCDALWAKVQSFLAPFPEIDVSLRLKSDLE